MIRRCATPGCGILTLGEVCLACEQKKAMDQRVFPRGRAYVPVVDAPVSPYATASTKASQPSQ